MWQQVVFFFLGGGAGFERTDLSGFSFSSLNITIIKVDYHYFQIFLVGGFNPAEKY